MSANPVSLSSNSTLYDFTTAMNKAYGQNPMIELVPGKYGMYAADGDANGVVNIDDPNSNTRIMISGLTRMGQWVIRMVILI